VAYTVNKTDGTVFASVADGAIDSTSSLTLIGRNTTNYGEFIAENTIKHLENFAHTTAPSTPLTGQVWFNKTDSTLRIYNGSDWERSSAVEVKSTAISTNLTEGTMYFDTKDDELKVYANSSFKSAVIPGGTITDIYTGNVMTGSSSIYGAKLDTLFLKTSGSKIVPVVAVKYYSNGSDNPGHNDYGDGNSSIMAMFSDHAEFAVDSSDPHYAELNGASGLGTTIKSGITLRSEYTNNPNARSDTASLANIAYAVDLTDPSPVATAAGRIAGKDLFRNNTNVVPDTDGAYTVGLTGTRFSYAYLDALNVGPGGSTGSGIFANGTAVDIGTSSNRFQDAYFVNVDVSGDMTFGAGTQNFGTSGAPVENLFALNATLSGTAIVSTAPSAATHITNKTYVDTEIASAVSSTNVVRTTGTQASIAGAKTFTTLLTGSSGISDGTASMVSGALSGVTTITASGSVSGGSLTDGTATLNGSGVLSGATVSATPSGANDITNKTYVDSEVTSATSASNVVKMSGVQAGITGLKTFTSLLTGSAGITDGTATLSGGAITGATTGNFSSTVTANLFEGKATSAQYADLAEIYKADREYMPGTVVKIGGSEEITQTTEAFDNEVFGVISKNPAYLMNSKAEGLPVALTGRVQVKVIGKIKKGERLVSADMEGFAWGIGSDDYDARAVIGRSLEDKDDGESGMVEAVIGVK
jgi:hypothetical protein